MLKGYAKPIVFSMLVGMLMLTGVYSYATQQTGVVPISAVLANENNQFYKVIIEVDIHNYKTVNYTITPENTTVYIPAKSTINRFILFINVTEPYIKINCTYVDPKVILFRVSIKINGEPAGEDFFPYAFLLAKNEDCTVATLYGNGWCFKPVYLNEIWEVSIWATSYLMQP